MQPGSKRVASVSTRQQQGASPARSGLATAAETIPEHDDKSLDTPYSSSPVPPGQNDGSHPAAPSSNSSQPTPASRDYGGGLAAGGAGLNYVSSSDSSSPLSETYRPANECRVKSANAATTAAAAASVTAAATASRKHSLSQKTCFKQVQFHLNNIALSAPLLKNKFSAHNRLCTAATSAATNTTAASSTATSTQTRLLNQIPILKNVRKTRKKRKKVKPSEAAREETHQKEVLANLPPSKAFLYSCLNKSSGIPDLKDIVYNGTYPIDQPLCSRFKTCSFSLSSTDTDLDSAREFEARIRQIQAESTADHLLRKRSTGGGNYVKTFAIDEPI